MFENREVAIIDHVASGDFIKGQGPFKQVVTLKFEDGSTSADSPFSSGCDLYPRP